MSYPFVNIPEVSISYKYSFITGINIIFILDVTPDAGVTSRSINCVDDHEYIIFLNSTMCPTMCHLASQLCLPGPAVCLVAGTVAIV